MNVLEHLLSPSKFIQQCAMLLKQQGILIVNVPNDFSKIQAYLMESNKISKNFWVNIKEHISYFNREGLTSLMSNHGFEERCVTSNYPIDFELLTDNSNYIQNPRKGKLAHKKRMVIWESLVFYFRTLLSLIV